MALDRRRFLQVTAAGMAASLTSTACAGERGEHSTALAQPALLAMLGHDRVRGIGAQYRAMVPRENSIKALQAAISKTHEKVLGIWDQSIEQQIHDDFAAGRVVIVGGWVLAVTEARQCALYSLSV